MRSSGSYNELGSVSVQVARPCPTDAAWSPLARSVRNNSAHAQAPALDHSRNSDNGMLQVGPPAELPRSDVLRPHRAARPAESCGQKDLGIALRPLQGQPGRRPANGSLPNRAERVVLVALQPSTRPHQLAESECCMPGCVDRVALVVGYGASGTCVARVCVPGGVPQTVVTWCLGLWEAKLPHFLFHVLSAAKFGQQMVRLGRIWAEKSQIRSVPHSAGVRPILGPNVTLRPHLVKVDHALVNIGQT